MTHCKTSTLIVNVFFLFFRDTCGSIFGIRICDITRPRSYACHVPLQYRHTGCSYVSLMWDMTHSYVWHDSFTCVTWLVHMFDMSRCNTAILGVYMCHSFGTWLIRICDMTHSYLWHDSFICVTWRIHMCDMTHSYVWHDAFICVTWRIHMCAISLFNTSIFMMNFFSFFFCKTCRLTWGPDL